MDGKVPRGESMARDSSQMMTARTGHHADNMSDDDEGANNWCCVAFDDSFNLLLVL